MTALLAALCLLAQTPDGNLEHRAKIAVEASAAAEKRAEAAYGQGEMAAATAELKAMVDEMETAYKSLKETGKSARKHAGPFKSAELKSQEILTRLGDLERRMDSEERAAVAGPRARVQEIHDYWFEAIMSKR